MDREVLVYVDLDGAPCLVGRLWTRLRKNKETATFEYDADWLRHPARFSLEPALQLGPGLFHTAADIPMFGAIGDSVPDRWGSCGAWSADVQNEKAVRRERFTKSITCCWSTTKRHP
jgi:hypothetical protein